jgi:ribulose-5-phosphate 4-epimerase/fuculose-1-phosphate aldolase
MLLYLGMGKKAFVTTGDIEKLKFYFQVTGTGGGMSIKYDDHIYIAPSGVQKERLEPSHMFVMDFKTRQYLRKPTVCNLCSHCVIDAE